MVSEHDHAVHPYGGGSRSSEDSGAGQARDSGYDAVVIGAGVGGLTAGALLARAGRKVLVVEADGKPGGYARTLVRGPYTFDRADHLIWGCEQGGPFGPGVIDAVLRHLGVLDLCEFIRIEDPVYAIRLPGLDLRVPHGREAFLEAHLRHFPNEAAGLRRLAETTAAIYREYRALPLDLRLADLATLPRRFPLLFRYRSATLKDVVDTELSDPRLRSAYSGLWAWIGPQPSRLSFLAWANMMTGYVEDGAYYCRGGFQSLADALAAGLTRAGGELLLSTPAARIRVDRGEIREVELAGGQRVRTPVVISNVDPRDTFGHMVGDARLPARWRRRLAHADLSMSVVALYAATDMDLGALGVAHDTGLSTSWDPELTYTRGLAGQLTGLSIVVPTLKDPSLAPAGEHLVILKAMAPSPASRAGADDSYRADTMLELSQQVLPGLRQQLTYLDHVDATAAPSASPLHLIGPIYGWAATPQQTGPRRLPQRTPIKGLILTGQWTRPGHGIWFVVQSGITAARIALGAATAAPAVPLGIPRSGSNAMAQPTRP